MNNTEFRICDHAHICNYGKDSADGTCIYSSPREEHINHIPVSGHCATLTTKIRVVPFKRGRKDDDPNFRFRIYMAKKNF